MKIAFDAGHALTTIGKETPAKEKEWSFNNVNARAFEIEMMQYENVQLLRTDDPTGKYDVPLSTRTNKSNAWGADLYISFHHNANAGVWGDHTGTETYVYKFGSTSHTIAKKVHAALIAAYGLRDRGVKEKNLHIVRETRCPAVLTEGGFMDSTIDIVKLRDDKVLQTAGRLVAVEVAKHFGLKRKETSPPVIEEPKDEGVQILTGGLLPENVAVMIEFLKSQGVSGWWGEAYIRAGENTRVLTGGLNADSRKICEDFLNAKKWSYTVYTKGEVPPQ